MAVDIKQAHRRLLEEAYGKGNIDVFDEICDSSYRLHDPVVGDTDLSQSKESCRTYRAAFPDISVAIVGTYAEGDTAIVQFRMTGTHKKPFMGIEATGARGTLEGIVIGKFRGGKLVEAFLQWDVLGLLRLLGVAPKLQVGAPVRETRPHA